MDTLQGLAKGNGAGTSAPAPLSHSERIEQLEQRLARVESEQARFTNALFAAGRFMLTNPVTRQMLMVLPKDAQIRLKEWLANGV